MKARSHATMALLMPAATPAPGGPAGCCPRPCRAA